MSQRFIEQVVFDYDREPSRDILCMDCRSFYASVECADRGWDALTTELVVMSYPSDVPTKRGSGLILASSPAAKKAYNLNNVSRARDLPFPYPDSLQIVPPRMQLYMDMNRVINNIYKQFADDENHHVYSVDESFLDVTNTMHLFGADTAFDLARKIQIKVHQETGIYVAVGIGDNPLLAKLALDNEAKTQSHMKAEWRYQDVPNTIWQIDELTDFWGIGRRMARRLEARGIRSPYDLAHTNYYVLQEYFGVIGTQLFAHSWGIDRTFLGETYQPKSKSIGNSQALPRDYTQEEEVRNIIKEMADQVGTRLRREGYQAQSLSLGLGYSIGYLDKDGRTSVRQQMKIPATHQSKALIEYFLQLFDWIYDGQIIRSVSVNTTNLIGDWWEQLDLFADQMEEDRRDALDTIVDKVRQKYGFSSLVYGNSLQAGSRAIERSQLIGGHAGGMSGIEGTPITKNL